MSVLYVKENGEWKPITSIKGDPGEVTQEEFEDLVGEVATLEADKANTNLSNLTEEGEAHFLNKSQITNCLLEVPQRVKLELTNGTLILKAGSEIIVPNGFEADGTTPKFDYVTVESDKQLAVSDPNDTGSSSGWIVFYSTTQTSARNSKTSVNFSGTTAPTLSSNYAVWYDTANNVIKYTSDRGTTWTTQNTSLPLCSLTRTSGIATSIDQVFNGIGYIGSTIWADKGVKGLISNGRNEDGTLNNIEFVTNSFRILTDPNTGDGYNILISETGLFNSLIRAYDAERNIVYNINTDVQEYYCMVGTLDRVSGAISNFKPKQPFRAVDYSESSDIAFGIIPSAQYINLTLGATGTTYTAPANGWFVLQKRQGGSTYNFNLITVQDGALEYKTNVGGSEWAVATLVVPVKGGQTIKIYYTTTGATEAFKFVYAESEV